MNAIKLLQRLDVAKEAFEHTVARILRDAQLADARVASALTDDWKANRKANGKTTGHGKRNGVHWASTPEGRAKISKIVKANWAKKQREKRGKP